MQTPFASRCGHVFVSARRAEVWMTMFNNAVGSELRGHHPAIVISSDRHNLNPRNRTHIIVPLSSVKPERALKRDAVVIDPPEGGLVKPSVALVPQLQVIDRQRLVRPMGELTFETMRRVELAIQCVCDLYAWH